MIGSDASLVSAAPVIALGVVLLGFVVYYWVDLAALQHRALPAEVGVGQVAEGGTLLLTYQPA